MACNPSACQSNCYRNQDDEETVEQDSPPTTKPDTAAAVESRRVDTNDDSSNMHLCLKCKSKERMSSSGVGDDGRFCSDCFRSNLFAKFRQAVNSNAMISPSDKVLVAFSGGPCSRFFLFLLRHCIFSFCKELVHGCRCSENCFFFSFLYVASGHDRFSG